MNIEALKEIQARRMEIAKRKNADYGRAVDAIAICGIYGLATRIMDKAGRILSLATPGVTAQVTDESIKDTLLDLANYADYGVSLLEGTWEKPTTKEPASQMFMEEFSPLTGGIPESLLKAFMEHTGLKPGVTYKEALSPLPGNCLMEVPAAANPPAMKKPDATDAYPLGKSWGYRATDDTLHPVKKSSQEPQP